MSLDEDPRRPLYERAVGMSAKLRPIKVADGPMHEISELYIGDRRFVPADESKPKFIDAFDVQGVPELLELLRLAEGLTAHAPMVPGTVEQIHEKAAMVRVVMGRENKPLPMVLHCPRCGTQHIDEPDLANGWSNPPHRSHQCQKEGCKTIWRPADVPTVGVASIETKGKADTWPPFDKYAWSEGLDSIPVPTRMVEVEGISSGQGVDGWYQHPPNALPINENLVVRIGNAATEYYAVWDGDELKCRFQDGTLEVHLVSAWKRDRGAEISPDNHHERPFDPRPRTALERVEKWEGEWIYQGEPGWGDKIDWNSAKEIARRLDNAGG